MARAPPARRDKGNRNDQGEERAPFNNSRSTPYTRPSPFGSSSTAAPRRPSQSGGPSTSSAPIAGGHGRPPFPSRPGPPPKSRTSPASLTINSETLTSAPDLTTHPRLAKLELTQCQGISSLDFLRTARHSLTNLNLSGTSLPDLKSWEPVRELSTLFVLNASNCSLKQVPSVIESLVSLKALVLSHNQLKKLEHVKRLPQLNTLVVSYNTLSSLPSAELSSLPQLKKLSASHNLLTSTSLPDLSSLSHLREIRLSNNPKLTSLPAHFAEWGHPPADPAEQANRNKSGLQVVDLGSCGFVDWFGLKELAPHPIVNLGLKGNPVVDEIKEEGFEEYRAKLTILLPDLRVLDNVRFDPKFIELKQKRDERTPEQKVLDAGPMGLAINAKKDKPVEIPKQMLEEREREKEMRRRKKGAERKRKLEDEKPKEEESEEETKDEAKKEKEGAEEEPAPTVEVVEAVPQRRKRGRDAKRLGLKKQDESAKEQTTDKSEPVEAEKKDKKGKKEDEEPRKKKKKKDRDGVLAALKGEDGDAVAEEPKGAANAKSAPESPKEVEEPPKKEKTSVLKVLEVGKGKKDRSGEKKVDVGDLLGLAKGPENDVFGSGWD